MEDIQNHNEMTQSKMESHDMSYILIHHESWLFNIAMENHHAINS